ncbi:MAG: universal stress protein [Firmicutes bacterium]|nr:universal stress protein [Bacillota bacterium]
MKILLAIDGSPSSQLALTWIVQHQPPDNTTIVAAAVEPPVVASAGMAEMPGMVATPVVDVDIEEQEEKSLQETLKTAENTLTAAKFSVSTHQLQGPIVEALIQLAADQHVDMIVAGRRGHGLVASVLLGSVSMGLLTHAQCPVLIVPDQKAKT